MKKKFYYNSNAKKNTFIAFFLLFVLLPFQNCSNKFRSGTAPFSSLSSNPGAATTELQAPVISQYPGSKAVNLGSPLELTVTATGVPQVTYQWFKDGVALTSQTQARLAIDAVQATDAGSYLVTVTNSKGSVSSGIATVTVNLPPQIVTAPQAQTVTAGSNITFSLAVTGTAPFQYQWQKGGQNIQGQTSATLVLNNVATTSSGTYTVIVTNSVGSVTSVGALLTVNTSTNGQVSPTITTQPLAQTVNQGGNTSFSVVASGTATLQYQWKKDGQNISGQTSATLNLTNVQANQAGAYSVTVSNAAGSVASQPASLTVVSIPVIGSQPMTQTVEVGANVIFSVAASGAPLQYQWMKAGQAITGQTSA